MAKYVFSSNLCVGKKFMSINKKDKFYGTPNKFGCIDTSSHKINNK